MAPEIWIYFSLALIGMAFLYASVGHGGASGYIALMAAFSFPVDYIKPTALILNIFISGISFWYFKKHNHFKWHLFYPFAITSVPAAFLGGYITIDAQVYKVILAIFLSVAMFKILFFSKKNYANKTPHNIYLALIIGLLIGLFSGMIGIGGGIILSPIIILLGWGNMKEAAAVSALFIFVNSIAGISGYAFNHSIQINSFKLIPIALVGGIFGAFYGSHKISNTVLKYILAAVLLIACLKLTIV
ncbi:sulfite exporter TauE/SafE family protein [Winogradskyella bathintestinalis]|uniref:Probable membrane transporter protein n=1 Tax=Winogradskyella bathintestinalis TaxID=3035208 RepID=A0ABT7ZSE1_9FLAO|nr:sulfite exporter TauE/SafE family protein [Winogradskyella bathintestinalis]MDN3491893.1 sulfite exporter TauE/SafE family protein [Winogradskyella bathintestinalis]